MHGLNGIGGINHAADLLGIFEVDRQVLPLAAPGVDDNRILGTSAALQLIQCALSGLLAHRLIDGFQIRHEGSLVFGGHVLHRVTNLVYHTQLYLCRGKDAVNGFRKAFQSVD
jgi:hypothetical protein